MNMESQIDPRSMDVGDLLLANGAISEELLVAVRAQQQESGASTAQCLVSTGNVSEEIVIRSLAELEHVEFHPLDTYQPEEKLLRSIPAKLIFHYEMLPLSVDDGGISIAFGDLPDPLELGNLRLLLGKRINVVLAPPARIRAQIRECFGLGAETVDQIEEDQLTPEMDVERIYEVASDSKGRLREGAISKLVDQILNEALESRATDIHIEPYRDTIRLRYRIDGILQRVPLPADLKQLYGAIVSRLKVMADLDISERRLPHDGRISMRNRGEPFDLRVSVIPTKHGETVCLRILGRESLFLKWDQLGMNAHQESLFAKLVSLPQGLILVTGPTGSGKTTSLYAALAQANDEGRKIVTIEDPVEYEMDGISQIQTRDDIGLTFAGGLRSVLRHDPDVVLVGEIRDHDTAQIAVRAAQTGHLVLSTLHANDSVGVIPRLIGMDMDPYLIAASLKASVAQRLTRRLCESCKVAENNLDASLVAEMTRRLHMEASAIRAWKGVGCDACQGRGFRGRVAVYEFLTMNDDLAEAITRGASLSEIKRAALQDGWQTLRDHALEKIQMGTIGLEELSRVTWRLEHTSSHSNSGNLP